MQQKIFRKNDWRQRFRRRRYRRRQYRRRQDRELVRGRGSKHNVDDDFREDVVRVPLFFDEVVLCYGVFFQRYVIKEMVDCSLLIMWILN